MGLGGIARDSIVGLNKIVQDDDNDDLPHSSRRHSDNGMLWTSGPDDSNAVEGKLKGAELSKWLRERAENDVADALIEKNLNPKVLRVRVAREKA